LRRDRSDRRIRIDGLGATHLGIAAVIRMPFPVIDVTTDDVPAQLSSGQRSVAGIVQTKSGCAHAFAAGEGIICSATFNTSSTDGIHRWHCR
jgi:hypothetical protein